MTRLWFVIPAWGRYAVTRMCLSYLEWLIGDLFQAGIDANAVVIADDANLQTATSLGFWGMERSNEQLGRKFNDGIEFACDQDADAICVLGSDNWAHPDLFERMPQRGEMICTHRYAVVTRDARHVELYDVAYEGGVGIRLYHADLFRPELTRPVENGLSSAIDSCLLRRLQPPRITYRDQHPFQVVGFQSAVQVTDPDALRLRHEHVTHPDPFARLAEWFPAGHVHAAESLYVKGGT